MRDERMGKDIGMERYWMDGRNWMEKINGWKDTRWMEGTGWKK